MIKVTSLYDGNVFAISDAFVIAQGTAEVLAPNSGETLTIGSSFRIEWSLTEITGNVKIELSRDGGTNWETLFGNTGNDGTQNWNVSGPACETALIRVTSTYDPTTNDISDLTFKIQ